MSSRTVYLHGFGHSEPIKVIANSVAEAVDLISRQLPCLAPNPLTGKKRISVVNHDTRESLYRNLKDDETEIHIVPQLSGGKQGGLLQILIGAVLVAAAFFTMGTSLAFATNFLFGTGAMMILGGIAQFLQPTPKSNSEEEKSHYLGAPKNTVKIGTRIPILYGRFRAYGHYLSFDINARDNANSGQLTLSTSGK